MLLLALLVVVLLVAATEGAHQSGSASTSGSAGTASSQGCVGSQTVTAHNGDNLTVLVENHVTGSYDTQRVVDIVVDMNGIADRNLIYANQQYRLPENCNGS
jgi:hypothetical protein